MLSDPNNRNNLSVTFKHKGLQYLWLRWLESQPLSIFIELKPYLSHMSLLFHLLRTFKDQSNSKTLNFWHLLNFSRVLVHFQNRLNVKLQQTYFHISHLRLLVHLNNYSQQVVNFDSNFFLIKLLPITLLLSLRVKLFELLCLFYPLYQPFESVCLIYPRTCSIKYQH